MCPTTVYVSSCYYMCVLIPLPMCPHASSTHAATSPAALTTGSKGMYICVLILQAYKLSVCICVLIPLQRVYVSSYHYICL